MATGVLLLWQFAAGLGYVSVVAVAVATATTPVAAVWWVRGAPRGRAFGVVVWTFVSLALLHFISAAIGVAL